MYKIQFKIFFLIMLLIVFIANCSLNKSRPREIWISNILANPGEFWNIEVKVIGIVQDIKVEPEGTRQGYYWLMDRNNQKIQVKTRNLPQSGKKIVLIGFVGQNPENALIPLIIETDRTWVWTSFIFISLGVVFVLLMAGLILIRFFRLPHNNTVTYDSERPKSHIFHRKTIHKENREKEKYKEMKNEKSTKAKPSEKPKQLLETTFIDSSLVKAQQKSRKRITLELEVTTGPDKGKKFHFTRSIITIGRAGRRLNDVELKDITISREQARLELNRLGDGFILHNEGKINPSLVNGSSLAVANLKPGDEILIGTTLLKYHLIT